MDLSKLNTSSLIKSGYTNIGDDSVIELVKETNANAALKLIWLCNKFDVFLDGNAGISDKTGKKYGFRIGLVVKYENPESL